MISCRAQLTMSYAWQPGNEEKRKAELKKRKSYHSHTVLTPRDQAPRKDFGKRLPRFEPSRNFIRDTCFKCGKLGHRANECRSQQPQQPAVCHEPGHIARNCKQSKSESNGRKVTNRQVLVEETAMGLLDSDSDSDDDDDSSTYRVQAASLGVHKSGFKASRHAALWIHAGADITGRDLFTTIATA